MSDVVVAQVLDLTQFQRVDEEVLDTHGKYKDNNAIHGPLSGDEKITRFEVYKKEGAQEITAVVHIGSSLCGHPGIVHGGIISAIFDNAFGWLFLAHKMKPAFTANLNINFRKPVFADSDALIHVKIKETQVSISFLLQ